MSETADTTHNLELTREYSTPYNALIHDDVVMGVPRYFLARWLPILGTNAATVINTLRQLNYRCATNDTVTISGTALAREAAMSRRHLYTCLETPWMPAFVRLKSGERMRSESGKIMQEANSYFVRMDDPLTPADADHLCRILTTLSDTPLDAAQRALDLDPRNLWAPDPKQPPERFTHPRAITARDVLQRAFPLWTPSTDDTRQGFALIAEALHRHVTLVRDDGKTSKIIVPQYFRKRWWPHLGHDLAWAYLWLRGCVYDNPAEGIRRETCWIPSLNTLLDVIGRPREWWRRNVENQKPAGDWSLDDFFKQQASQKGRDPANPQWVARQFWIVLDIPIAPEDQARYAELLRVWQPAGSATPQHIGDEGVSHIQTHRSQKGLPHSDTPEMAGSATPEHTGGGGVRHIQTQGSATSAHRDSESNQAPVKNNQYQNSSKHPVTPVNANVVNITDAVETAGAAGNENYDQFKPDSVPNSLIGSLLDDLPATLIDQIAEKLDNAPHTALYACATMDAWLQQTWLEPVRPHTPAWNALRTGQISPRDMIALMLVIWADAAIKHPPRYLSWLIQRWQTQPDMPPVDQWERWQALAGLPVGQWWDQGRQEWLELAPRDNRALPFGLDALWSTSPAKESLLQLVARQAEIDEMKALRTQSQTTEKLSNGLDERPGNGTTTIGDIWRATLGQLSAQLNRSTYQDWVEGTEAVSYTNGVLTVQAKHVMARDWLSKQLNSSIEATASALAEIPITVRYVS